MPDVTESYVNRLKSIAESRGIGFIAERQSKSGVDRKSGAYGQIECYINTDAVDLDGEVVLPDGMSKTSRILEQATLFSDHNYEMPWGIGSIRNVLVKDRPGGGRAVWCAASLWGPRKSAIHDPGDLLMLAEMGALYWSVGFEVLEQRPATDDDREKYAGERVVDYIISLWNCHEASATLYPCNISCGTHRASQPTDEQMATLDAALSKLHPKTIKLFGLTPPVSLWKRAELEPVKLY